MKLLASDFDSTLYQNLSISDNDLVKIKQWQAQGHLFGLVTGRDEKHLKIALDNYEIHYDFLVTNNGACIEFNKKKKVTYIPAQIINQLLEHLNHYPCFDVIVFDGHKRLLIEYDKRSAIHYHEKVEYKNLSLLNEVIQCSINVDNIQTAQIIESEINHKFQDLIAYRNQNGVDIVRNKISKASGLKEIQLKLQCEEVYVIGDSKNDIPMIEEFQGFCVCNADKEVKEKAKQTFHSVGNCIDYLLERA